VAGGVAAAFLLLWLMAAGDATADRRPGSDRDALRLLGDAAAAARTTTYEGMQVTTTWNGRQAATTHASVSNTSGTGTFLRGSSVDGGEATGQARTDGVRGGLGGFTATMLDLLARNYSVIRAKDGSICGRPAHVVEARRPDGTAAGRFWIDRDTGLMLYRELLDAKGRAASTTGFDSLRVLRAGAPAGAPQAVASAPGRLLATADLGTLRDHGWTLPGRLPGGLSLQEARRSDDVVHLTYSDGLSIVSVFVQPGRLDPSRFSRWRRATRGGRTVFRYDTLHRWAVWDSRGYVYTVLADAPEGTSDAVVGALPHGETGFRERVARGFARLNPFG
jgi:sigma-E factor negative regulatory protein RseB